MGTLTTHHAQLSHLCGAHANIGCITSHVMKFCECQTIVLKLNIFSRPQNNLFKNA